MPHLLHNTTSFKKTVAWNTSSQILARGVSSLTTFLITLVVARQFGAEGLGDFVKITTFLAFFYLVSDFGLNAIYLQKDSAWEDLVILRVCLSSILVVVATISLFLFPHGTSQGYTNFVRMGIILFTPSIVFQALITSANALFQKHLRYDMSTIALTVGSVVSVALLFFVTRQSVESSGVLFAILSLLVGAAATSATGLILTRSFQRGVRSAISFPRIWNLFAASVPLGVTLIFNLVYFRVDSIILTLTRSTAEVGVYGLAYKVFDVFLVFPTFFMNSVYPIMIQPGTQLPRLVKRSALFLVILSVIATIIFWIGSPLITWVRSDFAKGVDAARILALWLPLFFLSSLSMWILITKKKQLLLAEIYGISMIINIVLNMIFIPTYGYMAAAWITGISEAIVLIMSGVAAIKLLSL
jgi:O-antigen/teichoic acid export membrane protein